MQCDQLRVSRSLAQPLFPRITKFANIQTPRTSGHLEGRRRKRERYTWEWKGGSPTVIARKWKRSKALALPTPRLFASRQGRRRQWLAMWSVREWERVLIGVDVTIRFPCATAIRTFRSPVTVWRQNPTLHGEWWKVFKKALNQFGAQKFGPAFMKVVLPSSACESFRAFFSPTTPNAHRKVVYIGRFFLFLPLFLFPPSPSHLCVRLRKRNRNVHPLWQWVIKSGWYNFRAWGKRLPPRLTDPPTYSSTICHCWETVQVIGHIVPRHLTYLQWLHADNDRWWSFWWSANYTHTLS